MRSPGSRRLRPRTLQLFRVEVIEPVQFQMRSPGIEPGFARWQRTVLTDKL